ncbi:unnamed protein product, partial [Linum tenue]
ATPLPSEQPPPPALSLARPRRKKEEGASVLSPHRCHLEPTPGPIPPTQPIPLVFLGFPEIIRLRRGFFEEGIEESSFRGAERGRRRIHQEEVTRGEQPRQT